MYSDVLPKSESNREKISQFMCAQLCTDANGRRKDMRTYFHTHTHSHTHAYKGALESTTSSSEDSRRGAYFIFHQSIGLQLVKLILYSKRKKKKTKRRKRKMGKKSEKGCWKMLCLIDLRAKSVKRKRMSAFTPFPILLSINIHIHS